MPVELSTESLKGPTDGGPAREPDAWTRHVPRRHLDPEGGSDRRLEKRAEAGFHPRCSRPCDGRANFRRLQTTGDMPEGLY